VKTPVAHNSPACAGFQFSPSVQKRMLKPDGQTTIVLPKNLYLPGAHPSWSTPDALTPGRPICRASLSDWENTPISTDHAKTLVRGGNAGRKVGGPHHKKKTKTKKKKNGKNLVVMSQTLTTSVFVLDFSSSMAFVCICESVTRVPQRGLMWESTNCLWGGVTLISMLAKGTSNGFSDLGGGLEYDPGKRRLRPW